MSVQLSLINPWTSTRIILFGIAGQLCSVIHADHDKLWVEDVAQISEGSTVVQRQQIGDLQTIFDAFHCQWKQRWCRHDDVPFTHWTELIGFARRVLHPVHTPHLRIDPTMFLAECQRKKKRSATGLDGVSRDDLLAADGSTLASLTHVFSRAESDGEWPRQLLAGKVPLAGQGGGSFFRRGSFRTYNNLWFDLSGVVQHLIPIPAENRLNIGLMMEFSATDRAGKLLTCGTTSCCR